jgi:hypothetical protein
MGVPAEATRMATAVLIARSFCQANGVAFPVDGDATLARVAWHQRVLSEGMGRLPNIGTCHGQGLLADWGLAAERSLWNAAVGLGLSPGDAAPEAASDSTAAWLAGAPVDSGEPLAGLGEWAMWAFRDSGTVVLRNQIREKPVRFVIWGGGSGDARPAAQVHGDGFQVLLDVGDVPVMVDPGSHPDHLELAHPDAHGTCLVGGQGVPRQQGTNWAPFRLDVERARVDGRTAAVVIRHDGFAPAGYRRDVRVEGTKFVITDFFEALGESDLEIRWPLGPGFEPEESKHGFVAKHNGITLAIKLDDNLRWSFERGLVVNQGEPQDCCVVVGRGTLEGTSRIRCSFEIR